MLYFRARIAEQENNNAKNTAETKGTGCTQTHHGNFEDGLSEDGNREVVGVKMRLTAGMRRVFIWRFILHMVDDYP